jgi:hypothetical protein
MTTLMLLPPIFAVTLAWAIREHFRNRQLVGEKHRLAESFTTLCAEQLSQKRRSDAVEAILTTTLGGLATGYTKLQAYVGEVEERMCNAEGKEAELKSRVKNLSATLSIRDQQIDTLFQLAESMEQERATRFVGESLLELLRKTWPKPA